MAQLIRRDLQSRLVDEALLQSVTMWRDERATLSVRSSRGVHHLTYGTWAVRVCDRRILFPWAGCRRDLGKHRILEF